MANGFIEVNLETKKSFKHDFATPWHKRAFWVQHFLHQLLGHAVVGISYEILCRDDYYVGPGLAGAVLRAEGKINYQSTPPDISVSFTLRI